MQEIKIIGLIPFQLTEKAGKLYGRGTTDMKGGLMALIITLIELKEQNQLLPRNDKITSYCWRRKNKKVPNYWLIKAI